MVDGTLESIWSQLNYATRTLSPVKLVLKVTLFLLLHCTGVFLCFWGVLTRLDSTFNHTIVSDCDAKSRSLGSTLAIVRKGRIARSLSLVSAVRRTFPTKGKIPQ